MADKYISQITPLGSSETYKLKAYLLKNGRTFKVQLDSTDASTAFDGSANITDIGVTGVLPIANGGTGANSRVNAYKALAYAGKFTGDIDATNNEAGIWGLGADNSYTGESLKTDLGITTLPNWSIFYQLPYVNTQLIFDGNPGQIYIRNREGSSSLAWKTWKVLKQKPDNAGHADTAAALSPAGTTAQFWRGDNTWSNELSGGRLKITNYSNTVTIGSGNANYMHFNNSADIPFYFNKSICVDGDLYPHGTSNTRSLGSSSKRWKSLFIGTADSYGGTAKPIYWKNGVPTELSETVGATDKPVFLSSGTITASTSTIGSGIIPIYMSSGQIKASTSTVGSFEKPAYLNEGTITALNPVWLLTGGTATANNEDLNAAKYKAIGNYYSNGDAKSKTILNSPFGAAASTDCLSFTLKTEASLGTGTTYLRQLWRSYNSGVEAERTSANSGSSWSTWRTKVFKNSDATTTQGNGEQPIYIAANGQAVNTTYHLKAHVEDGSASHLAYYSAARTIDYTPNITFINGLAADVGTGKIYGLEVAGSVTGTADKLKAGEVGILQYGDAGPQLRFDSNGQKGAIIFTEYDNMSDSGGASFHFVTNQNSQGAAVRARYLTAGDNQTAGRIRIYQAEAYGDISANDKSSYGALKLTQAKGSYVGLLIGNSSDSLTIMDSGTSKGLYAQGTIGWLIYGHNTNKTVGIRTSSITSGYDIELGGTTHTSKLIHIDINRGTNLDNSRPLMIGPLTGANLAIGQNAIQARNDGEASILYLNYNAGSIQFGSSTSLTAPTKIFGTVTPGANSTYDLGTTDTLRWGSGFFTTFLRVGAINTTTASTTNKNVYIGPDGFYVNSIVANDSGYYLRNKGKNYATLLVRVPGVANTTGAARLTLGNTAATTAADNAHGEIVLYSNNASTYAYIYADDVTTSVSLKAVVDRFEMPKLRITSTADIGGKTSTSPPFSIGTLTSTHIEIDANKILAKNSDTTTGTLYLQDEDGLTSVAGSKGLLVKTTSQAWKESHDAEYRGGIKISDATNSNGAWNWIKQENTNAKRWFGMGTVAHAWYLVTSASTRTDAGYDRGILYYGNTGKIFVNKSYLDIHPDQGNYREGIRIYPNSNWSTIVLGGADLTEETGTSANSWSLHNYNGVFYLTKNGSSSQVNGGLSHSESTWTMIGSTSTKANTAAWSILALGNANNITTTNAHSQGALRLYSAGTKYVDIKNQNTTNNRSIWLQDYDSDQYLIHGGSDAKIGDTNLPVYIAANGRATKISYTLSANISAGTAKQAAYYSAASTISGTSILTIESNHINVTANSNTFSIGSQNANFTHLYNSANIPFIFNKSVLTTAGDLGSNSYPWNNIVLGNSAGTANADIVLHSSKANNTIIRFLVNTSNGDGQGIRIGGGGLTIIGGGESAATVQSGTGYASDAEQMLVANDSSIRFYPNQQSGYTASALIEMSAGRIWAGVNGDTTRENQIGVQSGAGQLYMYSAASATGVKGIYFPAYGDNPAGYIAHVDSEHRVYYNGNFTSQRVKLIANQGSQINSGVWLRTCIVQSYQNYANFQIRLTGGWSTGSPTIATIDVNMRNGLASMKLVHRGFLGVIGKVKLVKLATNTAYLDVYVREASNNTDYFGQFIGNVTVTQNNNTTHGTTNVTTTDVDGLDVLDLTVAVGNASTPVYIDATGNPVACTAYSSATNIRAATVNINNDTTSKLFVLGATTTGYTSIYRESSVYMQNNVLYGAAWNDYAEFRQLKENKKIEPGRVVYENGDDTLSASNERLMRGCSIVSDTYGFGIGESEEAQLPIAVSGRVLAYPYEDKEEFKNHIGWPVCSGPNGTVSIMTEEEEIKYPSRIIGTISAVPDYKIWHGGADVIVDGRVWIKVR